MKNVKIKVETDEQNLKVQERVIDLNKEAGRTAWDVYLNDSYDYYSYQDYDTYHAVCSRWKHHKYLVINRDLDLIICITEDIWKKREEKEVSYEEFMERKLK
jgi:hypothetical protein